MVEIIIIIFGLFAGIHMFLEKRSWLNPGTIFMFYWIIVVFMANLRLYGLRETSNKAYLFVLVGIIAFYTGSLLAIKMNISHFFNNLRLHITTPPATTYVSLIPL